MQENQEDSKKLSHLDSKTLAMHNQNTVSYDTQMSQSSDSSFQLNRLLNFNVTPGSEVEKQEQSPNSKQLLSFSVTPQAEDIGMYMPKKQRPVRDPMSHRIIEKRRRDRMNSCLADLSQLIPSPYLKQGQGRIEKTEIIEMAIKHIRQLQTRLSALGSDTPKTCCQERFCQGYEECCDNIMRYLMESLGFQPTESQNMYKYLETQLEKRKANLPAICTCNGPGPPANGSATATNPTPAPEQAPPTATVPHPPPPAEPMGQTMPYPPPPLPSPSQRRPSTSSLQQVPEPMPMAESSTAAWATAQANQNLQRKNSSSVALPSLSAPATAQPQALPPPLIARNESVDRFIESHDVLMKSPAISDTSVTPLVGDEMYVSTQEAREDSGIPSSLSSNTTDSLSDQRSRSQAGDGNGGKNGAYKFKNDIKWRFTANTDIKPKGDSLDITDLKEGFKDPLPPHSQSICSDSDFSNGNGSYGSSGNSADRSSSYSTGYSSNGSSSSIDTSLNNTVPAFALHPMGVYYIPLVLPVSQVMPFMKNHRSMGICHPISIPVSFTGPFHMGIPQVSGGLGNGYAQDKVHHHSRHRHGNSSRRSSHNDSRNSRRDDKSVQ